MPSTIGQGELLKDRYRLERTLGRGGMAAVWLGHDEVLDRQVAVKVLSDTIATDPDFVARFRREARTAAGLSHPNLVGVYDYSEEGERPYLVMQFVPGENLAERLARGEGVDCDKLARELLEALAHIHQVGILHRDIKPANIIIEPDGTAKLIDFGIALTRDATALTNPGLILGTERYAAPEVMAGHSATERSDLYSAGVVLRSCEGHCSRPLGALIDWMTAKEPGGRPASARQALVRLERAEASGQPTELYEPTFAREQRQPEPESDFLPPPPPAYNRTDSHRSRWGAIAAIVGVIAALLVLALVVLDGGGSDQTKGTTSAKAKSGKGKARQAKNAGAGGAAAGATGGGEAAAAESSETAEEPPVESESSETAEVAEAPPPEPSEATSSSGAALNEEGYSLLQNGEYEAAVPVLEEAVASFPEGSEDINYAYALFNLGHALRLSGRPEEAVPILEQRLEIPDQTSTVEAELEAARSEAG
ncbi:MAG TPA: serine/threonine-protein kinase [Solirubrobacterales bacterium]|nr:serine/threonine-protein kinase [Solirubrobacterales bacterium]